ncbi:MAG: ribosome silencing factor [Ignavibacteria bacterium]|nr:ribosome silencing factor [Ignavibacteria bacterium]MBP6509169.1 ribosome silencing factor [Candidatus Kapabacteria bacterium]MBK6418624.1 ribosome silencing factor [Ignavibacteria bacterium]MBK6760589.1 ribosome silencing factor [Ignavibacteria bacterium]MBK7032551.1 ribosome silencing factor [Ignavibacteria bacterium]
MATPKPRTTKGRAVLCARMAQQKQAHDLLILDLNAIEGAPAEFFVIVSVDSEAQIKAVSDSIEATMREVGVGNPRSEGRGTSTWVILDYFDVMVHIMLKATRDFYKLERLWGDAKAYTLTESGTAKATTISKKATV